MFKIDLHIHSPASKCFKDCDLPDIAGRMVKKSLDSGLKIIGITDHHTVDFVSDIQEAAAGTGLVVFPGVELSFIVGDLKNVYLLALFKENTPQSDLNRMIGEWSIPDSAKGNCHYRMEVEMDRVIRDVRRCGGVLISGHTDKDEIRKRAIPLLINNYGIELFDLKYSRTAPEVRKISRLPVCCFTFSDSHRIADIGQRYSEVELDQGSFEPFRQLVHTVTSN